MDSSLLHPLNGASTPYTILKVGNCDWWKLCVVEPLGYIWSAAFAEPQKNNSSHTHLLCTAVTNKILVLLIEFQLKNF